MDALTLTREEFEQSLHSRRAELRGYCYRMLASPFEAEDAVQETFMRAWRSFDGFEGRASVRSWLYRIATNVCLDMLRSGERRARPMDLGPAREPISANLNARPETTWLEPAPDTFLLPSGADPADVAVARDTVRLAFIAALQHLPPRQRAALILCEVLQWKAAEAATLLDTSVASVNSALQRARAALAAAGEEGTDPARGAVDQDLLGRYVRAFQSYDMDTLTALIHEDATQSMPPFDLWLAGRDDVFAWWLGPGTCCQGSRLLPAPLANGCPALGQYRPAPGGGYEPFALQVTRWRDGRIAEFTFFLSTERIFPLFGLPPRLDADGRPVPD